MQERAVTTHMITSYYGVPLMVENGRGLVIEVTDGSTYRYRGNLYYSLAKISAIHLAAAMAEELRPYQVTALSVTPGFLRSEQMLDHFGVTEENWQDATAQEPHFIESETPISWRRALRRLQPTPVLPTRAARR